MYKASHPELADAETGIRMLLDGQKWQEEIVNGVVIPRRYTSPIKIVHDDFQPAGTVRYRESAPGSADETTFMITRIIKEPWGRETTQFTWGPRRLSRVLEIFEPVHNGQRGNARIALKDYLEGRIDEVYTIIDLTAAALSRQRAARKAKN